MRPLIEELLLTPLGGSHSGWHALILQAYQVDGTDAQRMDAIGGSLVADIGLLLAECEKHMAYAGRNYLPFLLAP